MSQIPPTLGPCARRFVVNDQAERALDTAGFQVVTGFGPTNAPTAGTLSVMIGIVELQELLKAPMTVVSQAGSAAGAALVLLRTVPSSRSDRQAVPTVAYSSMSCPGATSAHATTPRRTRGRQRATERAAASVIGAASPCTNRDALTASAATGMNRLVGWISAKLPS